MKREIMDKKQMTAYLRSMKEIEEQIRLRKKAVIQRIEERKNDADYETLESFITSHTFGGQEEQVGSGNSVTYYKDSIFYIWETADKEYYNQFGTLIVEWKKIVELENQYNYIQLCINKLTDKQRILIRELFINRLTWEEFLGKYYLSRTALYRTRNRALDIMVDLYNEII